MITFEAAWETMMAAAAPLAAEAVPLDRARGRVLAQDVLSDVDLPPFHKAAMDGYACRRQDLAEELTVIEEVPAGKVPQKAVGPGQCSRIMTGAPVPEGATVVVMQEVVQQTGPGRIRLAEATSAANICARGEDLRRGEVVLRKGHLVTPARIALLGAVGCTAPLVYRQPRVGILATGDELVEPTAIPGPAQLRNSNSLQLCAQVEELGALARYHGIAPDRAAETTALLGRAQAESDMILLSGGVSTGAFDLVPQALVACGYAILFDSVAMQPGKPTLFARAGQRYCCGLPGNPAAAFVVFERLVKPFLYGLMGHEYRPRVVPAVLAEEVRRRSAARQAVLPVAWAGPGRVALVEYHGSAHVGAMARADGLLTLPVGVSAVPQGTTVDVRLL